MAANEALVARVRRHVGRGRGVSERRMFGGVVFLVNGKMACVVIADLLVVRLGEKGAAAALKKPHTREMDFTGKPMRTMVYVEPPAVGGDAALREWVGTTLKFSIVACGEATRVRFEHDGLVPDLQCFEICSRGWDHFFGGQLRKRLVRANL